MNMPPYRNHILSIAGSGRHRCGSMYNSIYTFKCSGESILSDVCDANSIETIAKASIGRFELFNFCRTGNTVFPVSLESKNRW